MLLALVLTAAFSAELDLGAPLAVGTRAGITLAGSHSLLLGVSARFGDGNGLSTYADLTYRAHLLPLAARAFCPLLQGSVVGGYNERTPVIGSGPSARGPVETSVALSFGFGAEYLFNDHIGLAAVAGVRGGYSSREVVRLGPTDDEQRFELALWSSVLLTLHL